MTKMELGMAILGTIVGALAVIFAKWGTKFKELADKTPTTVDNIILEAAMKGVEYADKYFNGSTNENKKTKATIKALEVLADKGVKEVETKVLNQAVETAVNNVREKELTENVEKK